MVKKVLCFTMKPKYISSLLHGKYKNGEEKLSCFNFPLYRHNTTCSCNWCLFLHKEAHGIAQDVVSRKRMSQPGHLALHLMVIHLYTDSSSLVLFFSRRDSFLPCCCQLTLHQTLKTIKISLIDSYYFSRRWSSFSLIPVTCYVAPLCHHFIVSSIWLLSPKNCTCMPKLHTK